MIKMRKDFKRKLTTISKIHYFKLIYRSLLFVLAVMMYITGKIRNYKELLQGNEEEYWLLIVIWGVYVAEMICRFFPSRLESPGCQKQFKKNYMPTGIREPKLQAWQTTFSIVFAWTVLNGAIGILYYSGVIDRGILVLISLAYGVCDMICILFFCPFQTWFMKNRCCTVCRIYNWDFAMMFTPFVFIPGGYSWSLLGLSLLLLLRWELTVRLHPERFAENTNAGISCKNCEEKLCHHKKQLQGFWQKNKVRLNLKHNKYNV